MSQRSIKILAETIRELPFGSFTASFVPIGTPFAHPSVIFHIQNFTDVNVLISFDGVNIHEIIGSGSFILMDVCANKALGGGFYFAEGTTVYATYNSSPPATGGVYLSTFYGADPQ